MLNVSMDRSRIYIMSTGELTNYSVRYLIQTERSIDRLFISYKRHMNIPKRAKINWNSFECAKFVSWLKKMELCKVLQVGEFNPDKNGGNHE